MVPKYSVYHLRKFIFGTQRQPAGGASPWALWQVNARHEWFVIT